MGTAQPVPTLGERLSELKPGEDETQAAFLGRAAGLAAEYPDYILTEEDLENARAFLPRWKFNGTKLRDKKYSIARRIGWAIQGQRTELSEYYKLGETYVSTESDNIVLLAKGALNGSNLATIIEVELANTENTDDKKVAGTAVSNGGHPNTANGDHRLETAKPETPSALSLTPAQREAIWFIALGKVGTGKLLGLAPITVDTRICKAMSKNNMNRKELLTIAFDEGLINMKLLPKPRVYKLTDLEQKILEEYTFSTRKEIIEALDMTQKSLSKTLHSIYEKMDAGLSTRTQAFLIGKRDGIL